MVVTIMAIRQSSNGRVQDPVARHQACKHSDVLYQWNGEFTFAEGGRENRYMHIWRIGEVSARHRPTNRHPPSLEDYSNSAIPILTLKKVKLFNPDLKYVKY